MTNSEKNLVESCTYRAVSVGGGEVIEELFFDGILVGERHILNGTREGDEQGEVSQIRLSFTSIADVESYRASLAPAVTCCHCGGVIIDHIDELYSSQYPNSSSMWIGQEVEQHESECPALIAEAERIIVAFKMATLSAKGKEAILRRGKAAGVMSLAEAIKMDAVENGILSLYPRVYVNLPQRR